jgi:hypothetical protein
MGSNRICEPAGAPARSIHPSHTRSFCAAL